MSDDQNTGDGRDDTDDKKRSAADDSEWGFSSGRNGMAKETKIALFLILVLLGAFGYVVYKKLDKPEDLLNTITASGDDENDPNNEDPDRNQSSSSEPRGQNGDKVNGFVSTGGSSSDRNLNGTQFDEEPAPNRESDFDKQPFEQANRQTNDHDHDHDRWPSDPSSREFDSGSQSEEDPFGATTAAERRDFSQHGNDRVEQSRRGGFGTSHHRRADEAAVEHRHTASRRNSLEQNPFGDRTNSFQQSQEMDQEDDFGNPFGEGDGREQNHDRAAQHDSREQRFEAADEFRSAHDVQDASPIQQQDQFNSAERFENYDAGSGTQQQQTQPGGSFTEVRSGSDSFDSDTRQTTSPFEQTGPSSHTAGSRGIAEETSNFGESSQTHSPFHDELLSGSAARQNTTAQSDEQSTEVYVVQPGDNYWRISKKRYGTARYFMALSRLNKQRIPDPTKMRPGMKVVTPAAALLESRFPDLFPKRATLPRAGSDGFSGHNSTKPVGFFRNTTGEPMYRIGANQTLSGVAKKHLGRASRWKQVFEMNRDRLETPQDLKIGTELRLPADARSLKLLKSRRAVR